MLARERGEETEVASNYVASGSLLVVGWVCCVYG